MIPVLAARPYLIGAAVLVAAALLIYHAGKARGRDDALLNALHATEKVRADTLAHAVLATKTATKVAEVAHTTAATAVNHRDSTAAHVAVVSDSEVRIDAGPRLEVPPKIVDVLVSDTLALNALKAENRAQAIVVTDLRLEVQLTRAQLGDVQQENTILRKEHRPRFGFGSGLVAGLAGAGVAILAVLTLAHR